MRVYDSEASLLADPDIPQDALTVIDYNMPGMNGIELVEHLDERHSHDPIIFITSGRIQDIPRIVTRPDVQDVPSCSNAASGKIS